MYHSACISQEGYLYTWGSNKNGQLGHKDYNSRTSPKLVSFLENYLVVYVSCGINNTFVREKFLI
jgi:alpha-tubulin suppressor-like RCC1 family protein